MPGAVLHPRWATVPVKLPLNEVEGVNPVLPRLSVDAPLIKILPTTWH